MQNDGVLAIIPARAGSKGLPDKNTIDFHGRPLITWTIDAAIKSQCFSDIIVSSNDDEVLRISRDYGDIITALDRPEVLCGDEVPGVAVALHAVKAKPSCKYAMLLQPTSPLRSYKDIRGACEFGLKNSLESLVSLTEVSKHPNWMFNVDEESMVLSPYEDTKLHNIRQSIPKLYQLNGAIYFFQTKWILKSESLVFSNTRGYFMPFERSIDIDTKYDLLLAKQIMALN